MSRNLQNLFIAMFTVSIIKIQSGKELSYNVEDKFSCTRLFDVSNSTIIKTTESLKNGARYLKAAKALSRQQCMSFCCDLTDCNMAVLQEKDNGDCYLFDCGTFTDFKCTFSGHANHVAMGLMGDRKTLPADSGQIDGLKSKHELDLNALKNNMPNAHVKSMFAGCAINQFQCENSGECIAVYDRCDGISQCADSSDEKYCDSLPASNQGDLSMANQPQDMKIQQTVSASGFNSFTGNFGSRTDGRAQSNANSHFTIQPFQLEKIIDKPQLAAGGSVIGARKSIGRNDEAGNSPVIYTDASPVHSDPPDTPSLDRLEYGNSDTSLAAVILGLGLAILALLLLFILCRLRKARRRLRRGGKVMDANEGEFLISGMYL